MIGSLIVERLALGESGTRAVLRRPTLSFGAWPVRPMRLIRGLHNLRPEDWGCVATIGNFDGVHLGHRAVFQRLLAQGRNWGCRPR